MLPTTHFEKQPSLGKLMLQNCVGEHILANVNSTKAVSKLVASIPFQRGGKKVLKGGGRGGRRRQNNNRIFLA